MIILTNRQKYILTEALKKGHLTIVDFDNVYAMPQSRKQSMDRFINAGFMREDPEKFGRFIIDKGKIEEVLHG